jgi:PhnB protein
MSSQKLPDGHHTVTPGMVVPGVARLIDFLKQAFDGVELGRLAMPNGHVAHAEVKIGDSVVMMGEAMGEFKPMPCMLSVYVDDVEASYRRALEAGATSLQEPADQFYGHRTARVQDPSGNHWSIHKVIEDVSMEECARRMAAMMGKG